MFCVASHEIDLYRRQNFFMSIYTQQNLMNKDDKRDNMVYTAMRYIYGRDERQRSENKKKM